MEVQVENSLTKLKHIVTKEDIVKTLKKNGIKEGMVLEVHASLSSFGYVVGGAQTVVDALIDTVGYNGTLLMSMYCASNSEPTYWAQPTIPYTAIKNIRDQIPAFDKKNSDTYKMGEVLQNLRRRSGVVISNHPAYSHIAWGKYSKFLCNRHSLHLPLSIESPLGRMQELRGYVLLMGCDYSCCSIFHLAEEITKCRPIQINGSAVEIDGNRIWKKYLCSNYDSNEFNAIGQLIENRKWIKKFNIGDSHCRLFKTNVAVNTAIDYYNKNSFLQYYNIK